MENLNTQTLSHGKSDKMSLDRCSTFQINQYLKELSLLQRSKRNTDFISDVSNILISCSIAALLFCVLIINSNSVEFANLDKTFRELFYGIIFLTVISWLVSIYMHMVTEKRTRLYTQRLNALLPSNSLIRLTLFKNLSDCVEFQECEQKIENFKKLLNTVEIGKDSSETENLVKKN